MRRTFITIALLAALAALAALAVTTVTAGATEQIIPASEFDLDDHAGKVVVVDFWASWCPPCKAAMPFLSRMQEEYGDQGLVIIAVNLDQDPAAADKMIAELHDDIIVVMDTKGQLAREYEVTGLPTALVVGRGGEVVESHTGFHESMEKSREAELQALLAD